MYPTTNVYVPHIGAKPQPITIEQVREHGRIVALSEDETTATMEVKIGDVISYCGVILNPDKTVKDFIPRKVAVNTFVKDDPKPEDEPCSED